MFGVVFFTVFIECFVEFSKGIGDSFSRGDAFTFFVLYFCDVNSHLCCFDSRDTSDTFELFKDSFNVLLSFHSFFSLTHFFKFLLRSFNRCLSSLGMFLLSSMSLRISASLSTHSSFFFAAADVVSCISLLSFLNTLELRLLCNTIEPASPTLVYHLCTKMFFWNAFRMFVTEWALFRQSLPCPQVAAAASASICDDFVCIFFTSSSHEWV